MHTHRPFTNLHFHSTSPELVNCLPVWGFKFFAMVTLQVTSRRSVLPRLARGVASKILACFGTLLQAARAKSLGSLWTSQHSVDMTMFTWKSLRGTKLIFLRLGMDCSARCCKSKITASFLLSFYRRTPRPC